MVVSSKAANLYITFELGLSKFEGQLMCRRAIWNRGWLCSNNGGGRVAMATEKAHIPWRDSIAWATVDWGVTISDCGTKELLGTRRGRHVMDVILYCASEFGKYPGKQRREDLLEKAGEIQMMPVN